MKSVSRLPVVFILFMCLFPAYCCSGENVHGECRCIYDFETDQDLDGLGWKCHSWYERSAMHATSGRYSLKVEMYPPEQYPGLGLSDLKGPWRGIRTVRLDIFNPGTPLRITFRIDDKEDPPYEDRINSSVVLHPGKNRIQLDLAGLKTSGTNRLLSTEDICAFMFFTCSPQKPVVIFVDNIRLCK